MTPEELFFKLNKIHRGAIVAGVCALLLVGFYFLVVSDMLDNISRINKRIDKIKISIANQREIAKTKPQLEGKLRDLEAQLKTMVASLPQQKEIEELIRKITDLAARAALIQKHFTPGKEVVNEKLYYAEIPFTIEVNGNYEKHGRFFTSLSELPRIINVPSVTLSRSKGGGRESALAEYAGMVNLNAQVNAVTYRRLSPQEIKAIEAAKKSKKGRRRKKK
jgi:type IV pilus assembly protein PilO